jgi:hypothetical protein
MTGAQMMTSIYQPLRLASYDNYTGTPITMPPITVPTYPLQTPYGLSPSVSIAAPASPNAVTLDFYEAANPFVTETNMFVTLQAGKPMSPNRRYFKGPWRQVATLPADQMTSATGQSTYEFDLQDVWPEALPGQAIWFRWRALLHGDYQWSQWDTIGPLIVTAAA